MFRKTPRTAWKAGLLAATVAAGVLSAGTGGTASALAGDPAANGSYAYTAKLDIGGKRACTGALVDPYWVITAASCFADNPAPGFTVPAGAPALATTVTVGRTDLTTTAGHTVTVAELVARTDRDLVMARLATPVTDVTPVPVATTAPVQGETLRVAGYGRTQGEWVPNKLHTATFNVDAVKATGVDITGIAPAGASVCKGDTGGPTIRESGGTAKLAAVASTSWQNGCLGSTETTRNGAYNTRVDDIAEWVQRTASSAPSGTTVAGSPFTIVDPVDHHIVTYLRDSNSHLWSVDPQGEGWKNFGAYAAADPIAVVNPVDQHVIVYVNGPNNQLWSLDERGNGWTQFPTTLSGTALAPNAVPSTVVDPADGHLVTFIRDTASHLWSVDPQGEGWVDFGPMAATDPTTIADPANGHLITYVNGPNNRLNMVDPRGNGWTQFPTTLSGTALAPNAVPRTVVDPADGHLVTFIRDTASHLWSVDPQGEGWVDFGPMAATDPTTIADPANGHLITYVNGPNNRLNMVDPRGNGW
ncbi:trypsin-like serine protease, partial [Kitasatospora sp. NPDC057223]|uniref:trypsin-like serine protease n=1 Tax=Kitasatospora sp. NPDC057223 TaxID=3346055 RepID=UPI0036456045